MKILFKIIIAIILAYSVVMMLINIVFSTLSLSSTVDNSIYFTEQFIPSICGILSMIYCLYRLFIRKSPKKEERTVRLLNNSST